MKRFIDIAFSLLAIIVFIIPIVVICVLIKITSKGPIIYWSERVGRDNTVFNMPKFRTMIVETPPVASHLLINPFQWLTPIGGFLRKSSLDELPQLFTVLLGEMSLVGPRPALFNQDDLIALRTKNFVHTLTPGLTGWAQIHGRDELPITQKVELDMYYLKNISTTLDFTILIKTIIKVLIRENITH